MADAVLTEERPAEMPDVLDETPAPQQPEPPKKRKFRLTKFWIFLLIYAVLWAAFWGASQIQEVSDFYLNKLHPPLANIMGTVSEKIPVPICEVASGMAVIIAGIFLFCAFLLIFLRKITPYRGFVGWFFKIILLVTVTAVGSIQVFDTWTMRSSVLGHPDYTAKEHTLEDVVDLWNRWQVNLNELMYQVDRDENGHFIRRSADEIQSALAVSRAKLTAEYGRFTIDAPQEKTSLISPFLHAYGIAAYTTSPTMEIIFSDHYENKSVFPSVYAHEFSHYCGYWREDEANYLGFLLCDVSDDPNIRYAGYLDLYSDLGNTLNKAYFGDDPVDVEDEGYARFCNEELVQFEGEEQIYLFFGDLSGNYKLYHELRNEENVVDEKPEYAVLPDKIDEIVSDAGDEHFSDLHEKLGAHYYDGVTQLLMDLQPIGK